jgi:hypothetical protein
MHMLYNSDSYSVVQFEVPETTTSAGANVDGEQTNVRGGFEIVDKFLRKEIYIEGALAASFMAGVEALINESPSEDELDEYISRFSPLMQQPLTLH